MSLILEALRKSEAERRRGLPPDLHAERAAAPAHARAPIPAWAWIVASLLVLAIAAWFWNQRVGGDEPQATAPLGEPASPAARPEAVTEAAPRLPARTPAPALPVVDAAPAAAPEIGTAEQQNAAPPEPSQAAASSQVDEVASPPQPRRMAPPPDDGRVLALGELDPGTRQALPPLKMSMHLWNEVPSQRFVILDGRRMTEGDSLGEASIVRIERDGVLLEWQGRGIRIPVP